MPIDFDTKRWERVKRDFELAWQGKLGRPILFLECWGGGNPGRPEPKLPGYGFHSYYDLSIPAEEVVDRWDYNLSCTKCYGDAFPNVWPNFGPGTIAAFMGADLENGKPPADTVWFHPTVEQEIGDIVFHDRFDLENKWFKRVSDLMRAANQRWQGSVQIGMTDLGGNLDILSSFRPNEKLLFDLYDYPDHVKRLTWEAHDLWWRYFSELNSIIKDKNPGYTCWTPLLSKEPYYMLQCDFCYMIGPDMFDEFVKPELARSCEKLKRAFYHLDGPGQLPHLDSLLEIKELRGVQWIPGAGQPDSCEWPEVYKKILGAGKLTQIWLSFEKGVSNLEILADKLGTAEGIMLVGSVAKENEKDLIRLCEKFGVEP